MPQGTSTTPPVSTVNLIGFLENVVDRLASVDSRLSSSRDKFYGGAVEETGKDKRAPHAINEFMAEIDLSLASIEQSATVLLDSIGSRNLQQAQSINKAMPGR